MYQPFYTVGGRGSLVVKVSDRGWFVPSSSPEPLKTRRVGQQCTLSLSRAQTASRWCGVVVRRGVASGDLQSFTLNFLDGGSRRHSPPPPLALESLPQLCRHQSEIRLFPRLLPSIH
ncbi:hypothetical protein TNCV_1804401 [Trichonephila clavipes]|nr:hypothetical protein TNCV_1804401 [Trichonephila clavipes]